MTTKQKLKLLLGITLSEIGGAQKIVYDITASLPEEHYDITLVTAPNGELIHWIEALNRKRTTPIQIRTLPSLQRKLSPLNDLKAFIALFRLIKSGHYDIAHFHSSKIGILGRLAAWLAGTPKIFFTVHGWGVYEYQSPFLQKLFGAIENFSSKISAKVICVSEYDRKNGVNSGWVDPAKVCILYNGVSELKAITGKLRNELQLNDSVMILGTICRLAEPKDPLFLIRVFAELKKRTAPTPEYPLKLVIIGDGPLRESCQRLITSLDLLNEVYLLGSRDDARDLLNDFDIFILFSKREALPVTVIEAMQAGKPIITSRVGGIPELIQNGRNGYLITHGSIQEGVDTISQLISANGAAERLRLGTTGQRMAKQKFTLEKMSEEYVKIYSEPLSTPSESNNPPRQPGAIKRIKLFAGVALCAKLSTHLYTRCINACKLGFTYFLSRTKGIQSLLKRFLPPKTLNKQEPLTLRANFSWVFTGNLVYAISRGIILMLIAKLGSPRLVGEFSLALAIAAPVFIAIDFNLRLIITTTNKEGFCFGPFMGLRLYSALLGVTLLGLIGLAWPDHQGIVIFWVGLAKGIETISDVLYGIFQKNERMDFIGKSSIWKGLLSVVGMGVIFGTTHNLAAGTAGLALVWFLLLIIYDLRNASFFTSLRPMVKFQNLRPLIFSSLPLGLMMILYSLNTNIPSYFIRGLLGTEALGFFSALLYLTAAADTLIGALGQSTVPKLAEYYQAGRKKDFYNTLFKLMVLGVGFGIAGMVICAVGGSQILALLYQPQYAAYWQIFLLLIVVLAIGAINSFCCYAITTAKVYKAQTILSGLTLLINIIFNAILIPAGGLAGAAFALIIAASFRLFGSMVIMYLNANNIAHLE